MAHELVGRVWILPDNIDSGQILPMKYSLRFVADEEERRSHLFEDVAPGLVGKIQPGDILWAGEGFGQGSSREDGPRLIKSLGIRLILATGFARIFYRNAINIGLPVAVGNPGETRDADELEVNLITGEVFNRTRDQRLRVEPVPKPIRPILSEGGLLPYIRKRGKLRSSERGRMGDRGPIPTDPGQGTEDGGEPRD